MKKRKLKEIIRWMLKHDPEFYGEKEWKKYREIKKRFEK